MPHISRIHLGDEELTGAVIRAVTHDGRINVANLVQVSVLNGVVLLSGMVRSAAQKNAAGQDAGRVPGVERVENRLTVATEGKVTDEELRGEIDRLLAAQPNLIGKVGAEVDDGVATLVGWASDVAEEDQALAIAAGVPGVEEAVSTLEIRAKRSPEAQFRIDDTTLTGQVAEALDTANVDIVNRTIRVDQGEVIIRGLVPSNAERRRARRITAEVDGVRAVHAHLDLLLSEDSANPDEALAARVLRALARDSRTAIGTLQVIARDGVVSIAGYVSSIDGQNAITQITRQVPGVKAIGNRTRLSHITSVPSDDKGRLPRA